MRVDRCDTRIAYNVNIYDESIAVASFKVIRTVGDTVSSKPVVHNNIIYMNKLKGTSTRTVPGSRSSRGHGDPVNVDSVRGVLMGNCFIN